MPFKQVFERTLNRAMQEGEAGRAPRDDAAEEANIKKFHEATKAKLEDEEVDEEMSEKKDRPPRFSTLFATPPSAPQVVETYGPPPKRKSGIYIPTSLFIVLGLILLFESTLLFAYTMIGLYNNLPSRFQPFAGPASLTACDCSEKQPAINIAPNFMMPQSQAETVTVTAGGDMLSKLFPTSASTTTSSSPAESSISSSAAVSVASNVASLLAHLAPSLTSSTSSTALPTTVVTITPPRSTVQSTQVVQVNAAGSTLPPQPTLTSVTVVPPPPPGSTNSAAKRSSVGAEVAAEIMGKSQSDQTTASPSTLQTLTSSTPTATLAEKPISTTDSAPATSSTHKDKSPFACFGSSGAAWLSCPDEGSPDS